MWARVCAILLLMSVSASAAESLAGVGVGTYTCSEYANIYRRSPAELDALTDAWMQGFMSGWNFKALVDGDQAKNLTTVTTGDQLWRIREYCDQHPLKNVVFGVIEFYDSLPTSPYKPR